MPRKAGAGCELLVKEYYSRKENSNIEEYTLFVCKNQLFAVYSANTNMKQDIHPKYYAEAPVTCSCGNTFKVGSTEKKISVEVCSACHPFYTGKQKLVDTAGRVDKFKKKLEEAKVSKARTKDKKKVNKPKKKAGNSKVVKIG